MQFISLLLRIRVCFFMLFLLCFFQTKSQGDFIFPKNNSTLLSLIKPLKTNVIHVSKEINSDVLSFLVHQYEAQVKQAKQMYAINHKKTISKESLKEYVIKNSAFLCFKDAYILIDSLMGDSCEVYGVIYEEDKVISILTKESDGNFYYYNVFLCFVFASKSILERAPNDKYIHELYTTEEIEKGFSHAIRNNMYKYPDMPIIVAGHTSYFVDDFLLFVALKTFPFCMLIKMQVPSSN